MSDYFGPIAKTNVFMSIRYSANVNMMLTGACHMGFSEELCCI